MSLLPENKLFAEDSLIEFLIFKTSAEETGRQTTYQKAVNSLVSFLHGRGSSLLPSPEIAVCDWIVHMCVSGTALKTALPYLNAIAGLYKQAVGEGLAPETDVFPRLRLLLKDCGDSLWKSWITKNGFEHLGNLTRTRLRQTDVAKLLLYSLTKGYIPLAEAAKVKIDSVSDDDLESLGIDAKKFTGNRKYIFSLNRSGVTPAQLAHSVNDAVLELMELKNISHSADADDTLRSYWAYAALQMGVSPHMVLSYLKGSPSGLPILSVCKKVELSEETRREIADNVAEMFTAAHPKWFVMRLRPRVRFDELVNKFGDMKEALPKPELFYPCEEIYRRTGKKITALQKPVIPDIVFFKYRETDVYPMFQKIGDIAWCYKTDGRDGNKYAPVPKREFERFQEAIGQFSPDYEVAPIGEVPLREGDKVIIIGGEFADYTAEIQKIGRPDAQGRTIYRMLLLDTGFEWTVSEDSRLVRKVQ